MKDLRIIVIILLLPLMGLSQNYSLSRRFWSLTGVNGSVQIGANYRYQAGYTNEIYNYQKSSRYYGGIMINTNSYFFHPNFVTLNLGGEFNPVIGKDLYLVVPDQSEVLTVSKFDATVNFFNQKPINFSAYFHYNDVYANRENLSNLRSNTTSFGGNFNWSNKFLPVQASYMQGKWHETEILTGRTFSTLQKNLQARIDKSFTAYDNNQLIYFHSDYTREDANISSTRNVSDNLSLSNTVFFDKKHNYSFLSSISGIDQWGSDDFRRFQIDESLNMNLPLRFGLSTSYHYYNYARELQAINQNSVRAELRHQLFESLRTGLSLEYNRIHQTFYTEENPRAGIDINYEKKIFLKGRLMLGYVYNWQRLTHSGDAVELAVSREEHILNDGQMTLLGKAYIDINTVVVRDVTGTIIYQLNFDYVLIVRNNFLEIQRMPGGQIPDKGVVYIDYVAMLPGSFKYNVNFQSASAGVSFFNRLIEIYVKWANQSYSNLETNEYLTLNYFTQTTYGGKLEYRFASGGAEFENYQSTLVPYRLIHYWLQLQGTVAKKVTCSFNANMRDYTLTSDNTRQQFIDITGNVGYQISPQSSVSVEFGYRKQVGQQIDLNLLTGRLQFTTVFRKIFIKVGADVYKRDYLSERTDFFGGFIQIVRTFNWYKK